MNSENSVYEAPKSNVEIIKNVPNAFTTGTLSYRKLMTAVYVSIIYVVVYLASSIISLLSGIQSHYIQLADTLAIISTLIWVYQAIVLKQILNQRLLFHDTNLHISLLIALSIIAAILIPFTDDSFTAPDFATIAYLILMVPFGIVSFLFGMRLLKIGHRYKYLKSYAWLNIISGLFTASIVLILLVIPLGLASAIIIILLFAKVAREAKTLGKM